MPCMRDMSVSEFLDMEDRILNRQIDEAFKLEDQDFDEDELDDSWLYDDDYVYIEDDKGNVITKKYDFEDDVDDWVGDDEDEDPEFDWDAFIEKEEKEYKDKNL